MSGEYNDAQIGGLDEEDVIVPDEEEQIDPESLMEAVDEFIEDTKMRFHKLSKRHREDYVQGEHLFDKNDMVPREEEIEEDPETAKADFVVRQLAANEAFVETADAKYEESSEEEEEEEAWDCESILSTYTNTDNHPGVIKT